jgi:hypothetical protein
MDTEILFYEKQQFKQWYIILFFIAINGFVISRILMTKNFNSAYENGDVFGFIMMALVNLLFVLLKMETTIKKDGIYLRFFPIIKSRCYRWEDIQKMETLKYNPILYGGWGIRYGVYSVSGNKALQLQFKNGSKLLLGTQQPKAIQNVLNSISKNENNTL